MRRCLLPLSLLVLLVASGCVTSASYEIATLQNAHDFFRARHSEKCGKTAPKPHPEWCDAVAREIDAFRDHLGEAVDAAKNGGDLPLQLDQIRADEKGLKRTVNHDG